MEETKKEEVVVKPTKAEVKKSKIVLKNTAGVTMSLKDYFYSSKGEEVEPIGFHKYCGMPVEREDLIEVFNKVFDPKDNFLFYKSNNKEVYIVIVPLKYSTIIGGFNESTEGEFQKHSISFLHEGSVNLDTLKTKLKKILGFVNFKDR